MSKPASGVLTKDSASTSRQTDSHEAFAPARAAYDKARVYVGTDKARTVRGA